MALNVYQQAYHVLHSSMKQFPRLQGKYYGRLGYLYYWAGEYALAEHYNRQSVEWFDEHDTTTFENYHQWNYHTARQHLGREFFFAQQHIEKGVELAEEAEKLCFEHGLSSQQRIITNLLARYNVSSSRVHHE